MKKYVIRVNGTTYDVEVEEVKIGTSSTPVADITPVQQPVKKPEPDLSQIKQVTPVSGVSSNSEDRITAPMAGTIVNVFVKPGDTINRGDVLLILEAMKMENDVMASTAGKILSVQVEPGKLINAGDTLITLEI